MADAAKDLRERLDQYRKQLQRGLEGSLKTISSTLGSSATTIQAETNKLREQTRDLTQVVTSEAERVEGIVLAYLRDGVHTVAKYPNASIAVAATATLLLVPGTRRLLYHLTVGRFRSEEGVYKSAHLRLKDLTQTFQQQKLDAKKLEERLLLAEQEYTRGMAKMKGAGQQLLSLQKQLKASQSTTQSLLTDLRRLPSQAALQLRSEAAEVVSGIKQQRNAIDRHVQHLLKQGLV